jgi:hypothetical protein
MAEISLLSNAVHAALCGTLLLILLKPSASQQLHGEKLL